MPAVVKAGAIHIVIDSFLAVKEKKKREDLPMINAASCISSSLTEYGQRYATVRPNHPTSSPNVPREKASPSQIFLCRKACHTWTIVTPKKRIMKIIPATREGR